jgi:hypothetical protein
MRTTTKHIVLAASMIMLATVSFAQNNIVLYTGYDPRLQDSEKMNDQPVINDTTKPAQGYAYQINAKEVKVNYKPDTISAVKMKSEPLAKLHRFYLKAGFGNYLTPYVDVSINSLRHKTDVYAFRYKHLSSQGIIKGVGDPWMSNNEAYADYKHIFKTHTIQLAGEYKRNVVHYYGYNPTLDTLITNRDSTKQIYNAWNLDVNFFSRYRTDSINWNHNANIAFYHIFDKFGSYETKFSVYGGFNKMTDLFAREFIGVNLGYTYLNTHNDSLGTLHGHFVDLNPYLRVGGENWGVTAGFKMTLSVDSTPRFRAFPDIRFHWNIFRQYAILYAEAGGEYKRNSFFLMSRENPFIMPVVQMRNTSEFIRLKAGVKGQFFENLSYNFGLSFSYIGDLHFYVNDTTSYFQRGFQVIYDNAQYLNVYGELAYMLGEKLTVTAKGNYHYYKADNLATIFHRPSWDASVGARYNLRNKLIFTADLYFRGGQYARDFVTDTVTMVKTPVVVELNPQVDLNLGAEYRITKNISVWVNFNNMAAWRYNRWYNYPTQQFNVLGGFTLGI